MFDPAPNFPVRQTQIHAYPDIFFKENYPFPPVPTTKVVSWYIFIHPNIMNVQYINALTLEEYNNCYNVPPQSQWQSKNETSILYNQASQYDRYVFELILYFWQLPD